MKNRPKYKIQKSICRTNSDTRKVSGNEFENILKIGHNKGRKRKVKTYLIILLDLHNQPVYSKILSVDENFRNFRELLKTDQIFTKRTIFLNERFY